MRACLCVSASVAVCRALTSNVTLQLRLQAFKCDRDRFASNSLNVFFRHDRGACSSLYFEPVGAAGS